MDYLRELMHHLNQLGVQTKISQEGIRSALLTIETLKRKVKVWYGSKYELLFEAPIMEPDTMAQIIIDHPIGYLKPTQLIEFTWAGYAEITDQFNVQYGSPVPIIPVYEKVADIVRTQTGHDHYRRADFSIDLARTWSDAMRKGADPQFRLHLATFEMTKDKDKYLPIPEPIGSTISMMRVAYIHFGDPKW